MKEWHIMMSRFFYSLIFTFLLMMSVPVSGVAAAISASIVPGLNVTGVTAAQVTSPATAFPLLALWKPSGVTAIESYNAASGTLLRAELDTNGNPSGNNFTLVENSALYVYSTQQSILILGDSSSCSPLHLTVGFNLASHACFPPDYKVSDFLNSLGRNNITSLSRLDLPSGRWQTAAVDDGVMVGDDFWLVAGEGYIIQAAAAVSGWIAPPIILPTINLSPQTTFTGLSLSYQLTLTLDTVAPAGGFPVTLTAVPAGIVTMPASVTIPNGARSVQVTVSANALGSAIISATSPGLGISGTQHAVTVKTTQAANYTPLISSQVGVQIGPVYTAPTSVNPTYTPVISAEVGIQVGPVFTGVSPIQTRDYGPLASLQIGVQVGENATAPTSFIVDYNPLVSTEVGVAVGPVITGVSPNHGAIGDNALPVTISGYGLGAVTGISFLHATGGITVGLFSVAPDGRSITVPIDIAANADTGARTVLVTTASGVIKATRGGSDIFNVTLPIPEISSISPLRSMVGDTVTMTIIGKNFTSASSVNVSPSNGIVVSNPPTVSADGTTVTVSFTIAAGATIGDRIVTVTAPGGTTSAAASVTNTFSVTSLSDPGFTHTSLSAEVGVQVQLATAAARQIFNYEPIASLPVGVTVGSTITRVTPVSGNIGSSNLVVRALGVGLNNASSITFYPPDGITVHPSSLTFVDGNPQVTIDIAAGADVSPRSVLVALSSGGYALPTDAGSNQFRVTLPVPEISSLQPIRAMRGQVVALTIIGTNFGSASSVDFTPSTGITVVNPPTVSADGTMITTSLTITADAALGNRVVTATTPGGTSSPTASTANSFSVTIDAGTTYTPLLSPEIGVLVSTASLSGPVTMVYEPVTSREVGIMVTPPESPTSQSVDYGSLVSTEVGVAVGGVFTGFSPAAMEPGSSATFTLTGVGLGTVTNITVVPSDNLTVKSWTPAADGRSGTVNITADSGIVQGKRTLVPQVGSTALMSTVVGIDILQIGYKPVLNSITTSYPASSVLAVTGSTVTLTMNGVHLQGVTKIEVLSSDGITVDNAPIWSSNETGEHVSVTVIVAASAVVSDRLVRLITPYGSSSATLGTTNTLKIIETIGSIAPESDDKDWVAANEPPVEIANDYLTVAKISELYGLNGRKLDAVLLAMQQRITTNASEHSSRGILKERMFRLAELPDLSRGPPGV